MQDTHHGRISIIHLFIAIFIAVIAFNFWFLDRNFQNVTAQETWVRHTQSVINEMDQLSSAIKDAESGMRGYVIVKNNDYLETHQKGIESIWVHHGNLCKLVKDNHIQSENCKNLKIALDLRLEPLVKSLKFHELSATERNGLFASSRERMEKLNSIIATMKLEEEKLLAKRSEISEKSKKYFNWSIIGCFILTVVVALVAYRLILKNQKRILVEAQEKEIESWVQQKAIDMSSLITNGTELRSTSQQVLANIADSTGALAGNFYFKQGSILQLSATFAGSVESVPKELKPDQTLVAEALKKNQIWKVQDIPANHLNVSSSLIKASPSSLVFVPFYFQGVPLGVVELALLKPLDTRQEALLSRFQEVVGVNLNAAMSKQQMQLLLEETQQQAEELQTQQEELRTSNEELEQQARVLERQQEALNNQNDSLAKSKHELESKAEELLRTSQYKSDFLAKMSHELRTPLNSLLILATLLVENKEKNLTNQQKDFAQSMYNAGNDLLNLINDILDLSKIEARKLTMRFEKFSLKNMIEKLRLTFEPQATNKRIYLKVEMADQVRNIEVKSDALRIEQILRNLLSNALKFTEHGGVTLKIDFEKNHKDLLRISVADTGIGIPSDKRSLIFEAFEQVDSTVSRQFGGTGLGLTISRELANLLGGRIELSSDDGKGSEFTLIIPVTTSEGAKAPEPEKPVKFTLNEDDVKSIKEAQLALKSVDSSKNTILIVEDDGVFRKSIAETTRTLGFEPIEAESSEIALQILQDHTPTAMLLDIKLPGMSGMGLLEAIKQMPHLRHVPVHMISALEYQQNALRLGALGYLSKPVTIDKVRSALGRIEGLIEKQVKNLLIIEDDKRQLDAIRELVSGKDLNIFTAQAGKDAIDIVLKNPIDCIILDLSLPDMSGFQFLEKLNGLDISLPPVVIYTGKDLTRQEEMELRRYSESIIIKGARSPERLLDEVNLFLHRVESLLPQTQQDILNQLRTQDRSLEDKTVLVVDDDLRNVFALTSALESKGLKVQIAKNGIEALESLEQDPDVNIILMDLMMPKMDGLEAIRRIRQQERFKNLPIVALTAKAMKEDQENCIAAGANDYLAKPLNLANLFSVMRVWLTPRNIFS